MCRVLPLYHPIQHSDICLQVITNRLNSDPSYLCYSLRRKHPSLWPSILNAAVVVVAVVQAEGVPHLPRYPRQRKAPKVS